MESTLRVQVHLILTVENSAVPGKRSVRCTAEPIQKPMYLTTTPHDESIV